MLAVDLAEDARRHGAVHVDLLGDHPIVITHQDIHPDSILIRPG
ncbi:hypothetical protein ABT297_24980 [Dactylosporangium sp. NPDC000555]